MLPGYGNTATPTTSGCLILICPYMGNTRTVHGAGHASIPPQRLAQCNKTTFANNAAPRLSIPTTICNKMHAMATAAQFIHDCASHTSATTQPSYTTVQILHWIHTVDPTGAATYAMLGTIRFRLLNAPSTLSAGNHTSVSSAVTSVPRWPIPPQNHSI